MLIIGLIALQISAQTVATKAALDLSALNHQIEAGSYSAALRISGNLIADIFAQIEANPPQSFEPSIALGRKITDLTNAGLLAETKRIEHALEAHDLMLARDIATSLPAALNAASHLRDPSPKQTLQTLERQSAIESRLTRFLALPGLATAAFQAADYEKAHSYASELLAAVPNFQDRPALASAVSVAIHQGNTVEGRLLFAQGDVAGAATHLLAAGRVKGSPALDTFGPSMSLALALLTRGQREPVLQYLSECETFWRMDNGKIATWKREVGQGQIPQFGANLKF